ncbi:tRNA pseudouridine(38-40) synthase TruA [Candidatus Dependentiae bacterium]|nr:tRNA pseudouridine(38-40) synthase TruA [Candidatus Dependentiae bacterium]
MTCYRIVVAYDGTSYHGWQAQPDVTTISQVLSDTFFSVFSQPILLHGASRTDAGVHALGQVAIVRCPVLIPVEKVMRAWNHALPNDILIKDVRLLDQLIHPHDGVVQKTYMYHFFVSRPSPFVQRYGWYYRKPVDIDLLQKALNIFVGTHDFRSFCTGDDLIDTVRTIDSIQVEFLKEYEAYRISLKGRSFLRYMVRRIVGASLEVASKRNMTLIDLNRILKNRNPCHTLPNSPAKGLLLYQIDYNQDGGK